METNVCGQGVEIFVADGGKEMSRTPRYSGNSYFPAIYCHLMTAGREPSRKFFRERLEAAVISRYAASSE